MEHFSNDLENYLNSNKSNHKLCNGKGASLFEFEGKSMETETTTRPKFTKRGKATVEQILGSEEIN